jgi:hypothetical protein
MGVHTLEFVYPDSGTENSGEVQPDCELAVGSPIGPVFLVPRNAFGDLCAVSFLRDVVATFSIERKADNGSVETLFSFENKQSLRYGVHGVEYLGYWFYTVNDPYALVPGAYQLVGLVSIPEQGQPKNRIVRHVIPFRVKSGPLATIKVWYDCFFVVVY